MKVQGVVAAAVQKHLKQKISQTKIKKTSPKSLLPSVPFKHIKKIIVIIPIKGTSTIKSHQPERFTSCSLLTYRAKLGTIKRKYKKIYIGPSIIESVELANSIPTSCN